MLRVSLPTLEPVSKNGGVARYIQAIVLTYPDNVQVVELPQKADYAKIILSFWKSHQQTDLYFIHHILPVGTVAWLLSYFGSRPYVIFLHGMDFDLARRNPWKRWLSRRILGRAQAIVVNSVALKMEIIGQGGTLPVHQKIRVVYPCVSDEFVQISKWIRKGVGPVDLQALAKLAVGLQKDSSWRRNDIESTVTLLTVGRLVERKGQLKVLDALVKFPSIKYHMVGTGPMRKEYEEEIIKRGLEDRVTLTLDAKNEDLPKIYAAADIFVMPTTKTAKDREGFGIAYLEAQLFALPVLATRQPGVDEAVIDGEGGILIDDNTDALVDAIQKLANDSKERARLGSRGRERVLSTFTREKQMEKLRNLLV